MESWEFGRALRRWRDRVSPETAGLPPGGRRRAIGLRREELAALAGISTDYLTRLEQGRSTAPSLPVVEALARGLHLHDAERHLLFHLAGHVPPGPDIVPTRITPSVQRLLGRLDHTPVAVYDATWTLIIANRAYDALMGETTTWRGLERNALWRNLVGPGNRVVHSADELAALRAGQIADLRMTASRYPADHALQRLVEQLTRHSPLFAQLWDSPGLQRPAGPPSPKRKTVLHPSVGPIDLDCDVLFVATDDIRIMMYTAEPGTGHAERLELALVLGTQSLVAEKLSGKPGL
ncbi:helix-turn-helix transcriptional regulator [Kineosporia mesophila]|uniref:Helix-turn-helix transcriptional regulator n=1 Tax=Kineosporia mesophila TaxID=566012 RepID=A0ABP7ASW3_9ACTN|nr:helix-turn-helix transcriptional regulator [Kineosporia mesophila]